MKGALGSNLLMWEGILIEFSLTAGKTAKKEEEEEKEEEKEEGKERKKEKKKKKRRGRKCWNNEEGKRASIERELFVARLLWLV